VQYKIYSTTSPSLIGVSAFANGMPYSFVFKVCNIWLY